MKKIIRLNDNLKLLHSGAGDGITDDTFYQYIKAYNWTGTLIEPLPNLYNNLHKLYKNTPVKTLNAGICFDKKIIKKVFWCDYMLRETNLLNIYESREQAISQVCKLADTLKLKNIKKYKFINSIKEKNIEFIPYHDLLKQEKYDIVHFCQPIVNTITSDDWNYIQDASFKYSVKLISYDKPNDYDNNLCRNINDNNFFLTNMGIGELDITKFSVPKDYGATKFDINKNYKYRNDRNLIINNEYSLE
jgi:hypothetical protein